MDLTDLVEANPHDHQLRNVIHGADDMLALFAWSIDNGMFVLISPDGGVRLYQDPDRPVPLNVVDIRHYQNTDNQAGES